MKLIDLHESQSQFFTTKEETENWLRDRRIEEFDVKDDLKVFVNGDVNLSRKKFTHLPVNFFWVRGDFFIYECPNLTTLVGSPSMVDGDFSCSANRQLKSLEGAPKSILGNFYFNSCTLTSLKDIHKYIDQIDGTLHTGQGRSKIKTHVLGLLKIKHLKSVDITNNEVNKILNKYLPEGNILDCIDELTDAGFEEYAKL